MERVDATVVVTVVQGKIWMSISPPFTWEAIMEPEKVDEVISALEAACDEVKRIKASARALSRGKAVVRAIMNGE